MELKFVNKFRKIKEEPQPEKILKEYYDRSGIDETNASYRMIIGQRSNGKTYSVLKTIIHDYFLGGKRSAYIRRYAEEITPKNIQLLFSQPSLISMIISLSNGRYNGTFYRANCFYMAFIDDDGKVMEKDKTPFCITRAINTWETSKGQDVGEISLICYDEFMTRNGYLRDEFICFCNLLSSLIRDREREVVVYMLANTVNKYCPYFEEMGLKDVDKMPQGSIRVYTYGDSDLKVAIEYCDPVKATQKTASKFFAFNNPQLEMVKNGTWEFKNYPHCPYKLFDEDIKLQFYIKFGPDMLCGKIVKRDKDLFIFFHRQTKDIQIDDKTIYYSEDFTTSRNHVRFLKDCPTAAHTLIKNLILKKSVCFSNNDVGELFRNFMLETQGLNLF